MFQPTFQYIRGALRNNLGFVQWGKQVPVGSGFGTSLSLKWEKLATDLGTSTSTSRSGIVLKGGTLYVAYYREVVAVDPADGSVLWRVSNSDNFYDMGISDDGKLFLMHQTGSLVDVVDIATQNVIATKRLSYNDAGNRSYHGFDQHPDGDVVAATGGLYKWDPANTASTSLTWGTATSGIAYDVAVDDAGDIYVVGSNGDAQKYNAAGALQWSSGVLTNDSKACTVDNKGHLFMGGENGAGFVLDTSDGSVVHTYPTNSLTDGDVLDVEYDTSGSHYIMGVPGSFNTSAVSRRDSEFSEVWSLDITNDIFGRMVLDPDSGAIYISTADKLFAYEQV